ncbi:MAG: putative acetyltransferase [Cellvibrionaceae bacterium]|jgi:putative acetyltransferase
MKQKIRRYGASDLEAVLSAWENASKVAHRFLTEAFIASEKHNIANLYMPNVNSWVAENQHRVIGFISMVDEKEVGRLFVQPEFHGMGFGRALMDTVQEIYGGLELEVFEANMIGRKFYAHYGFELVEQKTDEETGNSMLRLKFTADRA